MTDVQRVCDVCDAPFVLTAPERLFYAERGYLEPTTCPTCRAERRASRHSELLATTSQAAAGQRLGTYGGFAPPAPRGGDAAARYTTVCSSCGGEAVVPFQPRPGRPVYCRKCFNSRGNAAPRR